MRVTVQVHDSEGAMLVAELGKRAPLVRQSVRGMQLRIENKRGTERHGTNPDGTNWRSTLAYDYGFIKGTEGADDDEVDCFIGPHLNSSVVFIIDQVNAQGEFDEHKVMLAFKTEEEARAAYFAGYPAGWTGLGAITAVTVGELKDWLYDGKKNTAYSGACNCGTHDAALDPKAVQELVQRLMTALAIVKAKATKDEDPGHKFHGNQWTGGLGKKPEEVKSKGVKMGVHELLSSGHGFTIEELQKVTGATTPKQIADALAMLKNPKYAGPKGTLEIVKTGGMFHVKPSGEAPPLVSEIKMEAPLAAPAVPAVPEPEELPDLPSDDPEPEFEPGMLGFVPVTANPVAASNTKEAADKAYKDQMGYVMADVASHAKAVGKEGTSWNEHDVAMAFKNGKAQAMAQWAANTSGKPMLPKPQQVFEADKQLVKDLAKGVDSDHALKIWKSNTNAEKMGNFPPKAAINPVPKPNVPNPAASVAHPPTFEQVESYVPDGYVGVQHDDFTPKSGQVNGGFATKLGQLKSSLAEGHPDSIQNKIGVQKALEQRLMSSPAFQAIAAQHKTKNGQALAAVLISAWASTSGDTHPVSIANQISVRDAFKMNPDLVSAGNMSGMHQSAADDDKVFNAAAQSLGCKFATPADKETFKAGMRDFALAQYHNTQDHLKQLGISEVCVVRGMKISHGTKAAAELGKLKLQPASSYSANFGTAKSFASGQTLYFSKVPASQVLSSYVTGFGCSSEHEVVVLAHPEMTAVRMPAGQGASMSESAQYIRQSLGIPNHTPGSKPKYDVPKKPKNATAGGYAKAAQAAAKKGDLPGVLAAEAAYVGKPTSPTHVYIQQVKAGLQKHLAEHPEAAHGYKAVKAPAAPKGPTPQPTAAKPAQVPQNKPEHVPHTGPAPVGHTMHSHYDPVEYEGWLKKGLSTHQLGKKLAMKKFLAKGKA